ncbi:sugar transferase [Anaerobium acetethylicum]|uniref:Exopolysaccharide biosynthesis polyprenyl glycosylphosphotransferase n=1 Tax=Anaerobium acetethylicum TaxID=1619234 RepID=A0A1D3TRD5_9FIRM|nr:sugar transferase [Anaerobium acetethylicum]SCP96242.1 exopolysaccharide biosynthesis polyprenyl glycosylphosphotransferase [Anaerobium acetethylicum]
MYENIKSGWGKHWDFILIDAAGLQITFVMAYMLRNGLRLPYEYIKYAKLAMFILMADLCIGFFFESYKNILKRGHWQEFKAVVMHTTTVMSLIFIYLFVMKETTYFSRIMLISYWIVSVLYIFDARVIWKMLVLRKVKTRCDRNIILVVSSDLVDDTAKKFQSYQYNGYMIKGIAVIDRDLRGSRRAGFPVLACGEDLVEYIGTHIIDEVFINLPRSMDIPVDLLDACSEMGITSHIAFMPYTDLTSNEVVEKIAGYTVFTSSFKMASLRQLFLKRAIDVCGGLAGTLIVLVATVFVAPGIWLQSPGPVFFKQKRVGKNGRTFYLYKYRSMYMDAEERKKELMAQNEMSGFMFKMKDDPRIFPFGKILRDYSIDELPQFINVLKGDMSLVGTRPPTVDEYEKYELHHRKRLATRPGLTGMWQVSGRSDITDFEEVVALDARYIEEWNIGLDLKILLQTVMVVIGRKGSR